jgi:hypothetical protein
MQHFIATHRAIRREPTTIERLGKCRPVQNNHLRLIVDRNPPPLEALRELQREFDEPRGREAWFLLAGIMSALFWIGLFFLAGRMGWL